MKKSVILLASLLFVNLTFAQKYVTKNGKIEFISKASMENIQAKNNQVNCALDITTGDFVFKVLMKSFEFEKALMQEHFNENYVESDKFPNASFQGKVKNMKDINFNKPGIYNAIIEGDLTIHGVTKKVAQSGTFEVKDGKILGKSKFNISLKEFNINIPNTVVNNISDKIEITVDVALDKLNK
jgi:polyisoprenoid-binding protein YceI